MLKKYDAYLVGYYGMRNSGDDALMYATAWAAKHLIGCDNTKVGLYGDYTRETKSDHKLALKFNQQFPGQNRLLHYKTALQSKRIIFGGGSVLHSETDINLKRQLMSLSSPKKSLAVGVGIGPFKSLAAEKSCAKFLNECGYIGVRDNESFEIAECIAPRANVQKTFDLAPLLLLSSKREHPQNIARKGIALTLCSVAINAMGNTDNIEEEKRFEQFAQLITRLYQQTGEPITLIEFNGHQLLGDWKINNNIVAKLNKNIPITIKRYDPNPIALLESLASYKTIISMRLHGSILSYLANTPVLSINYHSKCKGWCDEIGMPKEYRINLSDLNIEHIVNQITQGLSSSFKQPTLSLESALKNSLSNWSIKNETYKLYSNYSAI